MGLINAVIWLMAGAIIGWVANRMISAQNKRPEKELPLPLLDQVVQEPSEERKGKDYPSPLAALPEDETLKEQFFTNDSMGG